MDESNSLNVLFASSDVFSPYLGVAVFSLLKNNIDDFKSINIYIFDDGISQKNKEKLNEIALQFNQNLEFIEFIDIQSFVDGIYFMEKEGILSLTTYARLFASSVFPNVDKLLYLDSDALIEGSFNKLWKLDMDNYYIAAVEDMLGFDFIKEDIGLSSEDRYVNAGVLLINLKKWREDNLEVKFLDFIKTHLERFIFLDQGVINGVCKGKILYLEPKYNLLGQFHGISYEKATKWGGFPEYYDKNTLNEAQNNPIFIHFTGASNRPWSNRNQHFYDKYFQYVNETPFKNDIGNDEISFKEKMFYKFYKSKFFSAVLKLVPMSLTIKFARYRLKNIVEKESKKD